MEFTKSLIKGKLIKRYKRFFVDVKLNKEIVTAHCPNTGSMKGLLDKGNDVFLLKNDDPKRKLKYGLEIIKAGKNLVGVNTHMANKIVNHGLENNLIKELEDVDKIQAEVFFNKETRFDFLIEKSEQKSFIEVKNVTLSRTSNLAEFPDAKTERGLKHIKELIKAGRKNYQIFILFLIQRNDCNTFSIAEDIDPNYANTLSKAVKNNLKILCYDCKFSSKGIKLNKKIKLRI